MRDPTDQRPLRHYFTPKYCVFNIMVYFVLGLFGWGFFVYIGIFVPELNASSGAKAWSAAIVFVTLWALTMVSYLRTVFRDPGSVPPNCHVVRVARDSGLRPNCCFPALANDREKVRI